MHRAHAATLGAMVYVPYEGLEDRQERPGEGGSGQYVLYERSTKTLST